MWRSTRTALSLSLSERLEGNWHAAPHLLRTSFFLVSSSDQSVRLWRQFDGELVAVLSRSYQPALGNTSSACGAESEGRSGHHGESSSLSASCFHCECVMLMSLSLSSLSLSHTHTLVCSLHVDLIYEECFADDHDANPSYRSSENKHSTRETMCNVMLTAPRDNGQELHIVLKYLCDKITSFIMQINYS